jgi:hypothetical protein
VEPNNRVESDNRRRHTRGVVATQPSPTLSRRETVVNIWIEFRTHLLPWLIAGTVIGMMTIQERQRTASLNASMLRQGQAIEAQNNLLATQGYLVPPIQGPRLGFEDFGSP